MIMFAIIGVIIVAIPISFYELSDQQNPTITSVHNQILNDFFYINITSDSSHGTFYPGISSTSTFTSSESLNSSLSMNIGNSSVFYNTCEGFYQLCINNFTISGNIKGNIRPTSITVMQTEETQYPYAMKFMLVPGYEQAINTSKISYWYYTDWNSNFENSTNMYVGEASCNISLLNDSAIQHTSFASQASQKYLNYKFELSNMINMWLHPQYYGHNVTRYFLSFIVSLNGFGKTIQTQINIEIIRGSGT